MKNIITFAIILLSLAGYAQEDKGYRIEGNKVVKVGGTKAAKAEPIATGLVYTSRGIDYPVMQSSRGSYFVVRVSKKSGKEYKQYLKINN
jgi:hypothetical protein